MATTPHRSATRLLQSVSLLVALTLSACVTTVRPTDPEYQGSVQIDDFDNVVDIDYCDGRWVMMMADQITTFDGPGSHTPLYDVVGNVVDAVVVRDADTLFVATPKEGVLHSINQGITFRVMPGLDTLGKIRSMVKYGGELVAVRTSGEVLRTQDRRAWKALSGVAALTDVFLVGGHLVLQTTDESFVVVDSSWSISDTLSIPAPKSNRSRVSSDDSQAIYVAGTTLVRLTRSGHTLRVDSVALGQDRDWRAVSVLGNDLVLLAGRNEIWWGSFDEPLQVQSSLAGEPDNRAVSIALTNVGLLVGFRGTEQSIRLNIKNANSWEVLHRTDGKDIKDIVWLSRSQGSVFAGMRSGEMYQFLPDQRRLLDVATANNRANILSAHGTYPNKLMVMYDGRILRVPSCASHPQLITPPVPFNSGLRVLDATAQGWLLHDASSGLYWTDPSAMTWKSITLPDSVGYLEFSYRLDDGVYAFGQRRLWYSTNDGAAWSLVLPSNDTVYAIKPLRDELLTISHTGWSLVQRGGVVDRIAAPEALATARISSIDIQNGTIALLTEKTLYVSNDRGKRWGSLDMARESIFTYVKLSNDRVFTQLPGFGLMMFDVYSDRPQP